MFGIKTKIIKLIDRRFRGDALKEINIYPLGFDCNHECVMCWRQQLNKQQRRTTIINNQKNSLYIDDYKRLIMSLPRSVKSIGLLGGGEPLLYSHIKELIKFIKKRKHYGSLITNGFLLSESIRQTLINSQFDFIRISHHAGTAKTYKVIHGRDDYKIVENNIKALLKERGNKLPYVALSFVIQKDNFNEIKNFVKLAERIGVDEIEFTYLNPSSKKELFLNKKELAEVKKDLVEINTPLKNNINSSNNMLNSGAWSGNQKRKKSYFKNKFCDISSLEVSQIGVTSPCCYLWDGKINQKFNIRTVDIRTIWRFYKPFRMNLLKGKFTHDCINNCNNDLIDRPD